MSILETLEGLVDELRGTRPSTKQGVNENTLHAATQYSGSLVAHFDALDDSANEDEPIETNEQALGQAKKEMEQLRGDIARLKAQLQDL